MGSDDPKVFYWMGNETPMNVYTNWYAVPNSAQKEPNDLGGNENCVEIYPDHGVKWNDRMCLAQDYFICEKYDASEQQTTIIYDPNE